MEVEVVEIIEVIEVELEDLEECGRQGRKPRHAKSYRIVVDRMPFTVHQHSMTGAEILALVGKLPAGWSLSEKATRRPPRTDQAGPGRGFPPPRRGTVRDVAKQGEER